MKKIIQILNHRWANLIAFVPFVNLLYLIFRFLVRTDESCKVSIWLIGLVGAPLCFLYPLVPDAFDWVVTYLILSAISILLICKSRGGYYPQLKFSKDALSFIIVGGIISLVLIYAAPQLSLSNQVSRYAEDALQAIANDDETIWSEYLHPACDSHLKNLNTYKEYLESRGIIVTDDFRVSKTIFALHKNDPDKTVTSDIYIISCGEKYRVDICYLENESGQGFTEFEIVQSGD